MIMFTTSWQKMLKQLANIIISLGALEELRHRTVPQQPKHCQLIFSSAAQSLCEWWTTTNRVLWPVLFIYAYMRVKLVKTVSTRYLYLWNCRQTDRQTENLARRTTTTTTDRPEECKAHKATIHTPTEGRRPDQTLGNWPQTTKSNTFYDDKIKRKTHHRWSGKTAT